MKAALIVVLWIVAWSPAQQPRQPTSEARVIAMDHLEPKGVTAWIVASPAGERSLLVARLGTPVTTRMRGRPMRDVVIDASARTAFVLVEREGTLALEELPLDGDEKPRVVAADLAMSDPVLGRAGEEVLLLTKDAVLAVAKDGDARPLFRRDDPGITGVAMNARRNILATTRAGEIELVSSDGKLLANLGAGQVPAFLDTGDVAFVREWSDAAEPAADRRLWSEIVLAETAGLEVSGRPIVVLAGAITRLRAAGDGTLLFRHAPRPGDVRDWLLHLTTGIIRPMDPDDRGALRAAASQPSSRPVVAVVDPSALAALPEPETGTSGFFVTDDSGNEYRTAYEESGWDDARNPDEARVHARLLERFLDGVQWPFRREGAYEPVIASDDEPLRAFSAVPHRGLDLGARLMHASTGSVAFHAPGTLVHPLYRGGNAWFGVTASIRDAGSGAAFANRRYPILQEVELRDSGCVLRIHIGYEHARATDDDGSLRPSSETPFPVSGDEPVGELEAFSDATPTGGWVTSDPSLQAAGIPKGNHVHVGIGGIYRSFNGPAEGAARKLRWYRDRLIPALKRSQGPR